jgi:acetylornithine deacetylase/succinyl-diaminopimelate desuccinylase-like protein
MLQLFEIEKIINQIWDHSIIPALSNYIRIPNKSPSFDPQWKTHGYMDQAMKLITQWCQQQNVKGMKSHLYRDSVRTPLLLLDIPGQIKATTILYGHMDKQPEMIGWNEGLGPWNPILRTDRLYGRGAADDGYAVFAALTAIRALQEKQIPHGRCIILIEGSEESGSSDLPYYMERLQQKFTPNLVVCLDSGCGNYEQLWGTTSLRGLISGVLRVQILNEGVHSGAASGAVPSSFRILRQLLSRIENEKTGQITLKQLQVKIPTNRISEAKKVAKALGNKVWQVYPWVKSAKPIANHLELILNRTWRPTLSVTGIDGIPSLQNAGNVLRPYTAAALSIRIPPTCDADKAAKTLKKTLEKTPPYGAKVTFDIKDAAAGWNAPKPEPWLAKAANVASETFYQKKALFWGEGGGIPFMGMLGKKYPQAQFMITGVLGPHSNAHGPNEFLHIPYAKKLTCCVASILAEHYVHFANK